MKRISIVGANGYIARNLVRVIKNSHPDFELKLYGIEPNSIDGEDCYTSVDLTDRESVKEIDFSSDIIFMFVGRTGSANGFDDYYSFISINEISLLNLLSEYVSQRSKARIIYPSTRLVYKGNLFPLSEEADKEFKTIYAMNKYACEQYLIQYNRVFDVQYTILRLCVPYGTIIENASSYGTADYMLTKAKSGQNITLYGDGNLRRTITYIEDLCKTLIVASLSETCANDVFNVGGEDYSLKEMAQLIANKFGVGIDYVSWPEIAMKIESGNTVFDSSKLDSRIGRYINSNFVDWISNCAF